MTDYCTNCGNVEADKKNGKYITVSNDEYNVYTEVFLCNDCQEQKSLNGFKQ